MIAYGEPGKTGSLFCYWCPHVEQGEILSACRINRLSRRAPGRCPMASRHRTVSDVDRYSRKQIHVGPERVFLSEIAKTVRLSTTLLIQAVCSIGSRINRNRFCFYPRNTSACPRRSGRSWRRRRSRILRYLYGYVNAARTKTAKTRQGLWSLWLHYLQLREQATATANPP